MKRNLLVSGFLILSLLFACSRAVSQTYVEEEIAIIPKPAKLLLNGSSFTFTPDTRFVVENRDYTKLAEVFNARFKKSQGWEIPLSAEKPDGNYILLKDNKELPNEAYTLSVDNDRILIEAGSYSGFLYGLQSLRQLLPPEIEKKGAVGEPGWQIPGLEIKDEPSFEWRGLMLDVSRHFFPKEYVLDVIDRLALHKMNTLHLHLVDDQGWRIEIRKYPRLSEVGGFRVDQEEKPWNSRPVPEIGEEATFGGFYTQDEIREIVSYARDRGITVVPEIEMPAHVMSAIAAYPWLSCNEEQIMVPSGGVWPITEIYCPGKESTFEFLEQVLLEVMDLFPSKYIHVGGDEATKDNWEVCPDCQKRMKTEGLANVEELQSYFIKRMERFISSHDRVLIGWDEILEGGLAPGAAVMSWRGTRGGWEASEQGHDVVMTPGSHVYFDHYQGDPDYEPLAFGGYTTLSKVYEFDPVVDSMTVDQKKHVLGGQANLWSEFIPTESHSEYMMFPRLTALSEVLWTPKEALNWKDFTARLKKMLSRYEHLGINYARSAFDVTANAEIDLEKNTVRIALSNEMETSNIRYALNDEELTAQSGKYTGPFVISSTTEVKAAVFEDGQRQGRILEKNFLFHKAVGKQVKFEPLYHENYPGEEEVGLVNVIRGSRNFHDGQWQGWLSHDMQAIIDLGEPVFVESITVGSMENQGSGIYYPVKVEALLSEDGKNYRNVGEIEREFSINGNPELKEFTIEFGERRARFVKVKVTNLGSPPHGGGSWLFIDEIIVK